MPAKGEIRTVSQQGEMDIWGDEEQARRGEGSIDG